MNGEVFTCVEGNVLGLNEVRRSCVHIICIEISKLMYFLYLNQDLKIINDINLSIIKKAFENNEHVF